MLGALTGQVTGGLSPAALTLAYMDWAMHLAAAPGKRTELAWKGVEKASRLAAHTAAATLRPGTPPCIEPLPGDRRFEAEEWRNPPFCFLAQRSEERRVGRARTHAEQ